MCSDSSFFRKEREDRIPVPLQRRVAAPVDLVLRLGEANDAAVRDLRDEGVLRAGKDHVVEAGLQQVRQAVDANFYALR